MQKIHIKLTPTDRLALCNIWPNTSWVPKELAPQQVADAVCKICGIVAERLAQTEPAKGRSAKP